MWMRWQYHITLLLAACCLCAPLIEAIVTQTPIPTRSLASAAAADLSRLYRDEGEGRQVTTARHSRQTT